MLFLGDEANVCAVICRDILKVRDEEIYNKDRLISELKSQISGSSTNSVDMVGILKERVLTLELISTNFLSYAMFYLPRNY